MTRKGGHPSSVSTIPLARCRDAIELPLRSPGFIRLGSCHWIFFYHPAPLSLLDCTRLVGVSGIWFQEGGRRRNVARKIIIKKREAEVLLA